MPTWRERILADSDILKHVREADEQGLEGRAGYKYCIQFMPDFGISGGHLEKIWRSILREAFKIKTKPKDSESNPDQSELF